MSTFHYYNGIWSSIWLPVLEEIESINTNNLKQPMCSYNVQYHRVTLFQDGGIARIIGNLKIRCGNRNICFHITLASRVLKETNSFFVFCTKTELIF